MGCTETDRLEIFRRHTIKRRFDEIVRDTHDIVVLQQHEGDCAVQPTIRLNTKLAYAFSHGRHLRMILWGA